MRKRNDEPIGTPQDMLDMLILLALLFGSRRGHASAKSIEQTYRGALRVDRGSLYLALRRLERRDLIAAQRGASENNRRAMYFARILNPNQKEAQGCAGGMN
jgi:DNA-binding PadR family transcriptional regulator